MNHLETRQQIAHILQFEPMTRAELVWALGLPLEDVSEALDIMRARGDARYLVESRAWINARRGRRMSAERAAA